METNGFLDKNGGIIVLNMISIIHANKDYLSEVDGLIGDGDHGINMSKGFLICMKRLTEPLPSFSYCLQILGDIIINEIGGSMGPIYGTMFITMSDVAKKYETITLEVFADMLDTAQNELWNILDARVGDKTLLDTLTPARNAVIHAIEDGKEFASALYDMKKTANAGMESTRNLVAKYGRSSRLGERSRGYLDAGAVSCNLILQTMADSMLQLI